MFLTETAKRADVVLPAASTYEKDGTVTNTAGEVQIPSRKSDPHGPAQRFRFAAHSFAPARHAGPGTPIKLRTPEAAFDEIRQNVPGYDSHGRLCSSGAAESSRHLASPTEQSYDVPRRY